MNYYKGDMKDYFLDKANIFRWQNVQDVFVTTDEVVNSIREYMGQDYNFENQEVSIVSEDTILNFETHLLGKHNQVAINLVCMAVNVFDVDEREFRNIVKDFKGVKGRLEFVKEVGGVKIYNDTCATTADATVTGLNALLENLNNNGKNNCKIVLISGGRDKELDMTNLLNKFLELQKENKLEIILLDDETTTGTKKLLEVKNSDVLYREIDFRSKEGLADALNQAISIANSGDVILFSPAFASFGMFKNEYDRGDKFMELVAKL
jgi:UDP-N-acetylmuramoylalanine--D-glutamate ligase